MKAWQIVKEGIDALQLAETAPRDPGHGELRVRVEASSINYRDLMTVQHGAARGVPLPRIPNSDGAGVVTAVGAGVAGLAFGDRVVSCFFQDRSAARSVGKECASTGRS